MKLRYASALLAGLLLCAAAQAQYVWVDDKGQRHYSDRPPGAEVPASRILRGGIHTPETRGAEGRALSEHVVQPRALSPSQTRASEPPDPTATPARKTLAEQEADFKKRRAEQADKEKQEALERKRKAELAAHCDRLRNMESALVKGERLSMPNKQGEVGPMDDAQRASELVNVRSRLSDCK